MDEILATLMSPVFWVCTVFVGFVMNVAAAYAKPHFDHVLAVLHRFVLSPQTSADTGADEVARSLADNPSESQFLSALRTTKFLRFRFLMDWGIAVLVMSGTLAILEPSSWSTLVSGVMTVFGAWILMGALVDLRQFNAIDDVLARVPHDEPIARLLTRSAILRRKAL